MTSMGCFKVELGACCLMLACSHSGATGEPPGTLDAAGGAPDADAIYADTIQVDVPVPEAVEYI
ncbi:MAG: hypothetical protein WDO74_09080 [Pseudomonadota bacterium]